MKGVLIQQEFLYETASTIFIFYGLQRNHVIFLKTE